MQKLSVPRKHISILTYLVITLSFFLFARKQQVLATGGTGEGDTIATSPSNCKYDAVAYGVRYKCTYADGSYTDATGKKTSIQAEIDAKKQPTDGTLEPGTITKRPQDCKYGAGPYSAAAYICKDKDGKFSSAADQAKAKAQLPTSNPTVGCPGSSPENPQIFTGLGCIPTSTKEFTAALLGFLAGISGAVALIIMLIGTIQIMTGGDNAEQIKKGKELFTGAITGLIFIIFSVTLLKIVAGDIIQLPGFKN